MKIDWMTLTKAGEKAPLKEVGTVWQALYTARGALNSVGIRVGTLTATRGNPFYAYNFEESETGTVVSIAADLQRQGMMLTFSGKVCDDLRNPIGLLGHAMKNGWKPTRVDVALDLVHPTPSVAQMADAWLAAHKSNKQKSYHLISGKTGDTFYVGSRKSPKMMRIYDKGAQQGFVAGEWVRVEIEYKGEAALGLAATIVHDIEKVAFEMAILYDTPAGRLTDLLLMVAQEGDQIKSRAPKPQGSTEVWFKQQVLPALKKLYSEDKEAFDRCWSDFLEVAFGSPVRYEPPSVDHEG